MNSVTRFLTPETISATLLAMRSGRKEIFFIVEGDSDVDLLSQVFQLSRSNFVSCNGKQNLNSVFALAPRKGVDEGSIFFCDRDHDNITILDREGTKLFATDYYDIEMQLLARRIFVRIIREYVKGEVDDAHIYSLYKNIIDTAAWLGALRFYNAQIRGQFSFDEVKLNKFIDIAKFKLNIKDFIRYMMAKSKVSGLDPDQTESEVTMIYESCPNKAHIVCGKDFLETMHLFISRHLKLCDSSECQPQILLRMLRSAAILEDLKQMNIYSELTAHVTSNKYAWAGCQL